MMFINFFMLTSESNKKYKALKMNLGIRSVFYTFNRFNKFLTGFVSLNHFIDLIIN